MKGHILDLTRDLCRYATGVVAPANEALFARLSEEVPLKLHRFPSGSTYNGWLVPQQWAVQKADLYKDGQKVFDGTVHPLAVAVYSKSFTGDLDWDALAPHLVTNEGLPEAYVYHCMWQYRPWAPDWALSIPYETYQHLGPGRYRVELETAYTPGEMIVADYEIPGASDKTIVFNCHTCHPQMANDAFAGVSVLVRLMQALAQRDNYYTYRLVLGPEHLGTVFYLRDQPPEVLQRLVGGVYAEMPGTAGAIRATSTFLGDQPLDRAFRNVLAHYSEAHVLSPWRRGAGNDETVWEAPGYEVPFVEMTRCLDSDHPYREYHTSLDTADLMDEELLDAFYDVLRRVVDVLEQDAVLYRRFNGLICLSNPDYDLYFERYDPAVKKDLADDADRWGHLLDSLFRYFDGTRSTLDIAEAHGLPFDRLHAYLKRFEAKGLVDFERQVIERVPISTIRSPSTHV